MGEPRSTRLQVEGMSCATCSGAVEDKVGALDGVLEVEASFATDEAAVTYDPDRVDLAAIHRAVEDAGYTPRAETLSLTVEGMRCSTCADSIEDAVGDVPGVLAVDANYATDAAEVTYNPAQASRRAIREAVEATGYTPREAEATEDEANAARDAERRRKLRLTLFGAALAAPLVAMMAARLTGFGALVPEQVAGVPVGWVELALATPIQVVLGKPFYENSYKALVKNRRANMDVLIALGSTTAYAYSVAALTGLVAGSLYFDTAALILVFITLGNYLEARSKSQAGDAMRELLAMEADTATLVEDGGEREVPVDEVEVGDRLRVRPGDKVPTDAVVEEGTSAVDESMVTGESVPVAKEPGDEVLGGTINADGVLTVRATRVGEETALNRIVSLVRDAQRRQPDVQRLADRISAWFVPAVILNALAWAAAWYLWPTALAGFVESLPLWAPVAGGPAIAGGTVTVFEFGIVVFASAVLIACPCALGLATPAATMVGTSLGARNGILFKGGDVLERLREADTVVFDKTGTLTRGELAVTDVVPLADDTGEGDVLAWAARAEAGSEHPLGEAIVEAARERGVDPDPPEAFENQAGRGVAATVDGREVLVGNRRLMRERGLDPDAHDGALTRLEREGKTAVLVAVDGRIVGVVAEADTVRATAATAVELLAARGVEVRLLTGDNEATARAVAEEVGIQPDRVAAEVLPGDKADVVRGLQEEGRRVAMVGDGVNDAPALVEAHVGIAIGAGADVALEAADVTLVRSDPLDVVTATRVSEGTLRKVKQNLFWALGYNTAMIPLASLGLLQPALAAGAMALSSVSVLANSLTFSAYDPREEDEPAGPAPGRAPRPAG